MELKVKLNRQFWKSDLWKKIWDAVKGEVTLIRDEIKEEVTLTTNLRTIHSSWILWLFAVAFTVITLPYAMMKLYGKPWSGCIIIAFIIIIPAVVSKIWLGKHIANTYSNEIRTKGILYTLNKRDVWFARISLFNILIILIMDMASVTSESYSWIYWVSVLLLIITTLFLTLPIVIKNKKEEK